MHLCLTNKKTHVELAEAKRPMKIRRARTPWPTCKSSRDAHGKPESCRKDLSGHQNCTFEDATLIILDIYIYINYVLCVFFLPVSFAKAWSDCEN